MLTYQTEERQSQHYDWKVKLLRIEEAEKNADDRKNGRSPHGFESQWSVFIRKMI